MVELLGENAMVRDRVKRLDSELAAAQATIRELRHAVMVPTEAAVLGDRRN